MTEADHTGTDAGTTDDVSTDERDGTREVLVPTEDSQGEHYHARGGCGGHLLTGTEATAEVLVSEHGLEPCRARGCDARDLAVPVRCNGCGKPVFDSVERHGPPYCAACADVLAEHPDRHGHRQYRLRDPAEAGDPLDGLRGDVSDAARPTLSRECPGCEADERHRLVAQYPAVTTTGAWGKYLNPVYRCNACGHAHTLLCYETAQDADRPEWGEYPPEMEDDDGPVRARQLAQKRVAETEGERP